MALLLDSETSVSSVVIFLPFLRDLLFLRGDYIFFKDNLIFNNVMARNKIKVLNCIKTCF